MQSMEDQTRDQGHPKQTNGFHQLPMELWIVIAEHFRQDASRSFQFYPVPPLDMPPIKSLRLTSRSFNAIVEPLYWERVELFPRTRQQESRQIIQHLHHNPAHRQLVKCLVLVKWRPPPPLGDGADSNPTPEPIRPHVDLLSEIFTKLHNLRAIQVTWSHMTCAMYEHLYSLQQLEYLEFVKPPIIPLEGTLDTGRLNATALRLKAIAVSMSAVATIPGVSACARLFLSPSLEQLSISSSMAPFIHTLTDQNSFDQLRHYEAVEPFDLGGFEEFYAFAAHCPNLTSIKFRPRITAEVNELDAIPSPPDNILTQLRCFDGTLQLAARIVPGRPVERVITACPSFQLDNAFEASLKRLSNSSRSIKALRLNIRYLEDSYLSIISRVMGSLEELEITLYLHLVPGVGKIETRLHLDQMKPLSRLRAFVLKNLQSPSIGPGPGLVPEPFPETADGPSQVSAMKELCKNHHSLEYVEIGQTARWSKNHDGWTWRSDSGSAVVDLQATGDQ